MPKSYAITRAWFGKWNRLIDQHPDWFLRVDACADLARAKAEGKIGIILGMQDANHLRDLDDVDAFLQHGPAPDAIDLQLGEPPRRRMQGGERPRPDCSSARTLWRA